MSGLRRALLVCTMAVACNGGGSEAVDASGDGSGGAVSTGPEMTGPETTGPETTGNESTGGESVGSGSTGADCDEIECGANEICDPDTLGCVCLDGFGPCDTGCCPVDTGSIWDGSGDGASITTDAAHAPHVSFLADINVLSYAHLTPSGWEVEMLGGEQTQQRPTAIALDDEGEPVIAYRGSWAIRVARRSGDTWTDEVAYESAAGFGPVVGPRGLAVDSQGVVHVVADQRRDSSGGSESDIWHLWFDGSQWVRESVASSNDNRYSLPSIVIDSDDTLHVAWTSFFDYGLNYATRDDAGWTHTVALDDAYCCDDATLALGPNGVPRIAYEARDLSHAIATGGAVWSSQSIRDSVGLVGDIAFDASGELVYSVIADGLRVGRPAGGGWEESVIVPDALSAMMTLDGEDAAHFVVSTDGELQYAYEPASAE